MAKKFILIILSILFIFTLSCSKLILVEQPQMRMLGGKTLIEAQVLGRYRQIDEAAYQLSVLSGNYDGVSLISIDTNLAQAENARYKAALIRSMLNEDEMLTYKLSHHIGENNKGYLSYMGDILTNGQIEQYSDSRVEHIQNLIDVENKDREVVAQYIILSDDSLTMANIAQIEGALYRRNIERLVDGVYYQMPNSQWVIYTNASSGG